MSCQYQARQEGVFYMNFMVNGDRVFRSTGKYTKKEAIIVEAVEKKKMMNEVSMTPQEKAAKMLLSEGIRQVYEHKWKKNNKRHIETHRQALRILSFIGDLPLGKIDDYVVRELIMKLEKNKLTGATINRYLAGLKTILRFNRQSWQHIVLRKERKGEIRVLSKDEENTAIGLLRNTAHSKRRAFYPNLIPGRSIG